MLRGRYYTYPFFKGKTMPMTMWDDIVGYCCIECGKWATHWYGDVPLCCSCHIGRVDEWMEKEAIKYNTLFQKGLSFKDDTQ